MFRENDPLPEDEGPAPFHLTFENPPLVAKIREVRCYGRTHEFNQTELSLLHHMSHQRISKFLKSVLQRMLKHYRGNT